jgi:hypothetical protein
MNRLWQIWRNKLIRLKLIHSEEIIFTIYDVKRDVLCFNQVQRNQITYSTRGQQPANNGNNFDQK